MTRVLTLAAATAVAFTSSVALASPQIPTWANPLPDQPVATDGSPLPKQGARNVWAADAFGGLLTGRSSFVAPRR